MSAFTINDDAMQAVVSKAILEGISADQKAALVEQAIQYLITPPKRESYHAGQPPTPLQVAFNEAVQKASRAVVDEVVSEESIAKAIHDGVHKAIVDEVTNGDSWVHDAIVSAIQQKLGDVFRNERNW